MILERLGEVEMGENWNNQARSGDNNTAKTKHRDGVETWNRKGNYIVDTDDI